MSQPPYLHLLKAEDIPITGADLSEQLTPRASHALAQIDVSGYRLSDRELLCRLDAALDQFGQPGPATVYAPADRARVPEDRYEEHDRFFRAIRVADARSPLEAFLRTQIEAYRGHLRDAMSPGASTLGSTGRSGQLRDGFDAIFALLRRHDTCHHDQLNRRVGRRAPTDEHNADPLARWILGHHTFFAMIQGLLLSLNCAINAGRTRDPGATAYIETATDIMRGSAAALRYAGDFSPAQYAELVRPAMMAPHLEPKFSGLQSRDHRYLLKVLAELRALLATLNTAKGESHLCLSYQSFLAEMRITYDEHKYVCARFGGDKEPSLRMSSDAQVPATAVLERLKRARIQAADF